VAKRQKRGSHEEARGADPIPFRGRAVDHRLARMFMMQVSGSRALDSRRSDRHKLLRRESSTGCRPGGSGKKTLTGERPVVKGSWRKHGGNLARKDKGESVVMRGKNKAELNRLLRIYENGKSYNWDVSTCCDEFKLRFTLGHGRSDCGASRARAFPDQSGGRSEALRAKGWA